MNIVETFKASSPLAKIIIAIITIFIIVALLCGCFFLVRLLFGESEPAATPPPSIPFVTATPGEALPTPGETLPTPTPPTHFIGWRGEYFDNPDLDGEPVIVRDDEIIDFDWGSNPPAPGVPATNFSVRWTISGDVPAGVYRVRLRVDDGARLWIDDTLIIDEWRSGPTRNVNADINLVAGTHNVRLEYFNLESPAVIQLKPQHLQNFPDWQAEYFEQSNFNSPPVVVRNEAEINYNWGFRSPIPGVIPANNFAVRWTQTPHFDGGSYLFRVLVEGGVRVWLDGQVLIDSWGEKGFRQLDETKQLDTGGHSLRVEYFKETGSGQIRFGWSEFQEPDQPPVAVINGPSSAQVGQVVNFNAVGSSVAQGRRIISNEWNFGDGAAINGIYVSHVYNSPGVYAVTLTVTDDQGSSDTTTHQIQINAAPVTPAPGITPTPTQPIAVIKGSSKARVGDIVKFDGTGSYGANQIVGFSWDFGDGTKAYGNKVQHVYLKKGTYTVRLTVTDSTGLQGSSKHQIRIRDATPQPTPEPDDPPTAIISAPSAAKVGETITVDASESLCADSCVSYAWDLGDGTQANAITLNHAYQTVGVFNIILTVTDEKGLPGTANHQIQVEEEPVEPTPTPTDETPPEPTATDEPETPEPTDEPETPEPSQPPSPSISGPSEAQVGQEVTFDGNASQPGDGGPIVSYEWDFGDGNSGSGAVVSHSYQNAGGFQIVLVVTDESGQSNNELSSILVTEVDPDFGVEAPEQDSDSE